MRRRTFLAGTAATAGAAAFPASAAGDRDAATLALVTAAADRQAAAILSKPDAGGGGWGPRGVLRQMRRLTTPFVWPSSNAFHDDALLGPIETLLAKVEAAQHDDGTFSAGNRHSPPDTAFLIGDMAVAAAGLRADRRPESQAFAARLTAMMRKAGPALATGGIHTPNHRWELCAALARIDQVAPDPAYRARIDQWLAEGVDIDADGFHSERSAIYASEVSNPSLLALARLPGLARLRDLVRRNLDTTIALAEPFGGEVETVQARRQDQDQRRQTLHAYYLQFRELALLDGDRRFAGVARWIERNDNGRLADVLADFIDTPELARPLPAEAPPFLDLGRQFKTVGLVRQRRGPITASLYAGSDWYADGAPSAFYNTIGSGLATNPTLMRLWKGGLVVDAVRLIPDFFNMGHFRPSEIAMEPDGAVRLGGELAVPYYQPMPADRRRPGGAYALSPSIDGRFTSALDFSHRPATFHRLGVRILVRPEPDGYGLLFESTGEEAVDMTLELTLRDGGVLEGARPLADGGFHLVEGQASYRLGDERLLIGPGNGEGVVKVSAGETYSWAGGRLQLPGQRLYITGRTPLRYALRLAFA
ncbi:hypothetical protein [Caulobacter rhizosphaerae]|jgi:hypothetical protein|uniref:hypothetical protein n=1 Tax=Caulobacter rhizosphaerae TaxID=2010972 RepID=UPI0013D3AF1C|nr:hypothetical protein [Caulobacter rhizosphaerae]GGL36672.1 hypothetical protein GCM10010983_37210 [Caulobacter rhizosphaerae]